MSDIKITKISWWIRFQLFFCKDRYSFDPGNIDDVGGLMRFKILKGRIYVLDMKILARNAVKPGSIIEFNRDFSQVFLNKSQS